LASGKELVHRKQSLHDGRGFMVEEEQLLFWQEKLAEEQ
jgi:hypothetical protein